MNPAPATTLRPCTEADLPLLFSIYASTRQEELAPVPWTFEQKQVFLAMQFNAQHTDYHKNYPDAAYDVIEGEKSPIGRLYVDRREKEICILDIALLPEYRGKGVGTRLISEILAEAALAKKIVTIHVERNNPALRLYQRFGFTEIDSNEIYLHMERLPA